MPVSSIPTFAPRLLGGLMFVAIAYLSAQWAVRILSPGPVSALPDTTQAARLAVAESDLLRPFGQTPSPAQGQLGGIRLTGVYAYRDGGFATFQTGQGAVSARKGEAVLPGLTLTRIGKREVGLSDGTREHGLRMDGD